MAQQQGELGMDTPAGRGGHRNTSRRMWAKAHHKGEMNLTHHESEEGMNMPERKRGYVHTRGEGGHGHTVSGNVKPEKSSSQIIIKGTLIRSQVRQNDSHALTSWLLLPLTNSLWRQSPPIQPMFISHHVSGQETLSHTGTTVSQTMESQCIHGQELLQGRVW